MTIETMSGPPPVGVYQVGQQSPDNAYMTHNDPRIKRWLTNRNIDYDTVYRVRLFSRGAWVSRFKRNQQGSFYRISTLDNNVARRFPLWVWQ